MGEGGRSEATIKNNEKNDKTETKSCLPGTKLGSPTLERAQQIQRQANNANYSNNNTKIL